MRLNSGIANKLFSIVLFIVPTLLQHYVRIAIASYPNRLCYNIHVASLTAIYIVPEMKNCKIKRACMQVRWKPCIARLFRSGCIPIYRNRRM